MLFRSIPYAFVQLDLRNGEQRREPFTRINPFGKVPALVDDSLSGPDGEAFKLFESGAILFHLAERYGEEFEASGPGGVDAGMARRSLTAQWLLFANATLGPAMFQLESRPEEMQHLLGTLNRQLETSTHMLAGSWGDPGWGAADCVVQAYLAYIPMFCPGLDLTPYPAVTNTIEATSQRPAYRKVMGLG